MPQPLLLNYQSTATLFTPSIGAVATALTMGTGYGTILNLPAVDANNRSVTLLNGGNEPVLVSFGLTTPKTFSDAIGTSEVVVPPGGPYLLTGSAFPAAGASATACISTRNGIAPITIQRGTVSAMELFQ